MGTPAVTAKREVAMSDLYSYRSNVFSPNATQDLSGFEVEAADGSIGKIDEATYETSSIYVVADTGFWIFGKKRLIPAGVVERVDDTEEKVYVRMTKDQIKDAPDYDPDRFRLDRSNYNREVADYYSQWS